MRKNIPAETLIAELYHNAQASGNRTLERRLADLTLWFHRNKARLSRDNLASRQDLLEQTVWILIEVNALLLERNHELEAAKRGMSNLWLPRGITIDGGEEFR